MTTLYLPERAIIDGTLYDNYGFLVSDDGMILDVAPHHQLLTSYPSVLAESWHGQIAMPGGINGHNHAFQILLRGMGEDKDFMTWRSQFLYPVSERLTTEEIYQSARLAYWDMLRHGITSVADFFYLNDQGTENALAIARAARDVGMRLLLARTFYDWEGAPRRYRETPDQAHRHTLELAKEIQRQGYGDTVTVHVAPHSPHGASGAMVAAAVATAKELDTYLHIHVAEGRYEREAMLAREGLTPIAWCHKWGALTPKSLAIHAVWVDEDDLDILRTSGAAVVHNPGSNMILGDGIAPVTAMLERSIPVLLGTDGGCTNDRHSLFDEMRLAALLQKVHATDSSVISAETVFQMGTRVGAQHLGIPAGRLITGELFDVVTLSLDDVSLLPGPTTLRHIIYGMSPTAISQVYVGGQRVVQDGRPERFDPVPLIQWARHWGGPDGE